MTNSGRRGIPRVPWTDKHRRERGVAITHSPVGVFLDRALAAVDFLGMVRLGVIERDEAAVVDPPERR